MSDVSGEQLFAMTFFVLLLEWVFFCLIALTDAGWPYCGQDEGLQPSTSGTRVTRNHSFHPHDLLIHGVVPKLNAPRPSSETS